MARKKPKGYGYVHVKKQQRKRPGRHSKKPINATNVKNHEARVDISPILTYI